MCSGIHRGPHVVETAMQTSQFCCNGHEVPALLSSMMPQRVRKTMHETMPQHAQHPASVIRRGRPEHRVALVSLEATCSPSHRPHTLRVVACSWDRHYKRHFILTMPQGNFGLLEFLYHRYYRPPYNPIFFRLHPEAPSAHIQKTPIPSAHIRKNAPVKLNVPQPENAS